MHDADGVGLAATQVGILRRLFVFNDDGEDRVVVNPVLAATGEGDRPRRRGCLSLGPVRMPVERPVEATHRGIRCPRCAGALRAGRPPGARRATRARSSRRHADHRSHRSRVAARGDGAAATETRPDEVGRHGPDRRCGDGAVRCCSARRARPEPRDHGAADAPRRAAGPGPPGSTASRQGRRRAARYSGAPARSARARSRSRRTRGGRVRLRAAGSRAAARRARLAQRPPVASPALAWRSSRRAGDSRRRRRDGRDHPRDRQGARCRPRCGAGVISDRARRRRRGSARSGGDRGGPPARRRPCGSEPDLRPAERGRCHVRGQDRAGRPDPRPRPAARRARSPRARPVAAHRGAGRDPWTPADRLAREGGETGSFEPVEVQPDGGKRMDAAAWLRGLR